MTVQPSWSSVPPEVLRRAFELQPDGLDNCAASVTCKAWRAALAGSKAGSVYLYAATDSQEQRWQQLLSSRSSIKSLKLVRAACWNSSNNWYTLQRSNQTAKATLNSIPTACRALTLSEFCSHYLALYVQKAPQLERLSFEWGMLPPGGLSEMQTMPDLRPLQSLTELEVKMRNDVHGDMFSQVVQCCPDSLSSLKLHCFGSAITAADLPSSGLQTLTLLEHCLTALTKLELNKCIVTIAEEDIIALSKLSSLSLAESKLYTAEAPQFERLTALTYLDLTHTSCTWHAVFFDVLDSLTAWPGLLVLKMVGCSLIGWSTPVVLGAVQEAHVSCPIRLVFTDASPLQLYMHASLPWIQEQPFRSMSATERDAAQKLVTGLTLDSGSVRKVVQVSITQLSKDFPNLRSLNISESVEIVPPCAMLLFFESRPLLHLTKLHLQGLKCTSLNLQCLSSLVHLDLFCVDPDYHVRCVLLPTSLQSLQFSGCGLFDSGVKQNLLDLACLSNVTLSCRFATLLSSNAVLPKLPCCVRHLRLPTSRPLERYINWPRSSGCQSVRNVTLQSPPDCGGPLDKWLGSLPHLVVIDCYHYDGPPDGTRLPYVNPVLN